MSRDMGKEPEQPIKKSKTEDKLEDELKSAEIQVVSKPFLFKEGNHEDYQQWRVALSLYHMGNLVMFKDKDYSQILNTLSFMKGKAMDWVEDFIVKEDIKNMEWKTFEKHLDEMFTNVNDARNMRVKVLNHCFDLCNQTIQEAFIQFEGWIRQARALTLGYDGCILIQALKKTCPPASSKTCWDNQPTQTQTIIAGRSWPCDRIQRHNKQRQQPKTPTSSTSRSTAWRSRRSGATSGAADRPSLGRGASSAGVALCPDSDRHHHRR